jgi:hypothetical protein
VAWKDTLAAARASIHEFFAEPADYLAPGEAEPTAVTVRVHDTTKIEGDLNGVGYTQIAVDAPRIVFLAADVAEPKERAVVTTADGRRYKIDHVLPVHGITITCEATRLPPLPPEPEE